MAGITISLNRLSSGASNACEQLCLAAEAGRVELLGTVVGVRENLVDASGAAALRDRQMKKEDVCL